MPILNEFHSVKRGNEIKEFVLNNLPQNAKIVMGPVCQVTDLTAALPAVPGKCYLIHAAELAAVNAAGNAGTLAQINGTPYGKTGVVGFLNVTLVPSAANASNASICGVAILTAPGKSVQLVATNVGATYAAVYYSEVEIIDG